MILYAAVQPTMTLSVASSIGFAAGNTISVGGLVASLMASATARSYRHAGELGNAASAPRSMCWACRDTWTAAGRGSWAT